MIRSVRYDIGRFKIYIEIGWWKLFEWDRRIYGAREWRIYPVTVVLE